MFNKINPKQNFPELENKVQKFWEENSIFKKQINQRPESNKYVFYDGPPFITGLPHYGHLLGSISKDIIPRYKAMKGYRVDRIWGWDCHGLPIENKVEKEIGLKNRRDIEEYGIDKFVDKCYEYTRNTSSEWNWYIDKIGRWVDMDKDYRTMDQNYMESVMWVFKELYDKDLIYEGTRTSLYCTRCGTPVSNFEIAMDNSYREMEDPAITVKFPLKEQNKFPVDNVFLLAWTTTPWTIPSNRAIAVDKNGDYVLAKVQSLDIELEQSWLLKSLPEDLKKHKKSQITQAYIENYKDPKGRPLKNNRARVRKIDGRFEFTAKINIGNKNETGQLLEETREISKEEYIDLIKQAKEKTVKTRYYYPLENNLTAEIDVYENDLKGFSVVEVEFSSLSKLTNFKKPDWFGKEVTDSKGVFPGFIAGKSIEEINKINEEYVQEKHSYDKNLIEEHLILGKERVDEVLGDKDYEIIEEFKGEKLVGLEYSPPYNYIEGNENDFKVYHFDGMVSSEEGVGLVHSAPGYGDIDTKMGKHYNLTMMFNVDDEGNFVKQISDFAGMYVKEADPFITEDLKRKNLLFKAERIVHRFPYCYRCETPLIQKAQPSWFIDIQKIKPGLLKNNQNINWIPSHLKDGRFGKGLEDAPDWGISRSRYWGTPMPIWQKLDSSGKTEERIVVGSRDELMVYNKKITKLIFVRHGEADKDKHINASLNEQGKKQALSLSIKGEICGSNIDDIDTIISSSMMRCVETAQQISNKTGLEVVIDEGFGSIEMKKEIQKYKKNKNIERIIDTDDKTAHSILDKQIEKDKETIRGIYTKHTGKTVVIVTHAEVIARIRYILEGGSLVRYFKQAPGYGETFATYMYESELLDLHRPVIDKVELTSKSGNILKRIPETLDVWIESASMPYAQVHYPFENKKVFEDNFPADYISEYIAQTRAWFYVMHVISTALFNKNSYKNVVTTGVIFGNDGRKMSKSFGNYPDPKKVLEKYGGDALRMYLSSLPLLKGENANIDEDAIKGQLREFILPLWNIYKFLLTYAEIHDWSPKEKLVNNKRLVENESHLDLEWDHIPFEDPPNVLDRWIITKLQLIIRKVTIKLDQYDIPGATQDLSGFLGELSKWYIRRSRDRFKDGDRKALETLYYVLVEFTKLLAPFTPFVSESIYRNLVKNWVEFDDQPESVHLNDFPHEDIKFLEKYSEEMTQMDTVMSICSLGQTLRVENQLKVRQPLSKIEITVDNQAGKEKELLDWMQNIIKDELNIKQVQEISLKEEHNKLEGFVTREDNQLKVTIDTNLTKELEHEGLFREIVRNIQAYRKRKGYKYGESVDISLSTDDSDVLETLEEYNDKLILEINTEKINIIKNNPAQNEDDNGWEKVKLNNDKSIFIQSN